MKAAIVWVLNYFSTIKLLLRGYIQLEGKVAEAEGLRLINSWQGDSLPKRQRKLVDKQLRQYRSGERIDVFDVFVNSVSSLPELAPSTSLLEVGCSSGFYFEVLQVAGLPVRYTGCDYSDAFIRLAKEKYPSVTFEIQDATELHYADSSFDVVVSGCCLLHIPDYKKGIAETARVARLYAIFHRTPVVRGMEEQWYRKQAYGVETLEIHFNEPQFLELLERHSLKVIATYTLDEFVHGGVGSANRTYVCKKLGA